MMKFQKCKISIFWYAFFIVSVGSLFTYFIHRPSIGIDDANITQVYAKNIADGFGYVYNIGSERVEGSTSLVWTVVNLIFFVFFENSEKYITAFCFVLTVLTVREALILLGYLTYKFKINYFISAFLLGSFLVSYPSFFTWMIWALMDVTIWTFLFTVIVCRFCSLLISENIISIKKTSVFLLCFALAILPLVRPEGLVVSVGFTLLFLAFAHVNNLVLLRKALMISLGGSILLLATFTIWRLQYFGFPVPNTFYAKVSLDYFNQVISGTKYLVKYLVEPIIAVQILFSFGLIGYTYARFWQSFQYTNWLAIVWLSAFTGIFALYITLGGDHFSSARQFQVLTPLLSTLASVGVANIICRITENIEPQKLNFGKQFWIGCLIIGGLFIFVPNIGKYIHKGGNLDHEFRIAENGRALGAILNQLPIKPSLGVITSGGIARSYDGHIYDLMGLNWVSMAHANRLHNTGVEKNHAAFNREVFFNHQPDIVRPRLGACLAVSENEVASWFSNRVLDGILLDEKFKTIYIRMCYKGTTFYIKREIAESLNSILELPK